MPVRLFTPRMHSRPSVRMFSHHGKVEMDSNVGEKKKEVAATAAAVVDAINPSGTKHQEVGLAGGAGEGRLHPPCYLEEASWWSILTFG